MILHRIRYDDEDGRRYEWLPSAPKARERAVALRAVRKDAVVDKIIVPETKRGLSAWLTTHLARDVRGS